MSCVSPAIITTLPQSVKGLPGENKKGEELERPPARDQIETSRRDLHLREVFDIWRNIPLI